MDGSYLRRHLLPQLAVVTKLLRLNPADEGLGMTDMLIELLVGPNVEAPKSLKELGQVGYRHVAKHFRFAVCIATEPLRYVLDQPGELFGELGSAS